MAKHPEMQTIGLHVTPPGLTESLNIACSKPGKVGKVSADIDTGVIASGKPSMRRTPKGAFDMGLPISDAAGHPLGMVVIVIRETFTGDPDAAIKQARLIRDELQHQLPALPDLFAGGSIVRSPLSMIAQTPLPDVRGGFDHFAVNLKHNRLYVAAEENHSIEVFDLAGEFVHSAPVVKTPHTLAYDPKNNLLLVADGSDASCMVLDGDDLHVVKRIALPTGPDAGLYDDTARRFYIGTGNSISVISVDDLKEVASIRVDSTNLEGMAVDRGSNRLYVNLRDKARIAVISLASGMVETEWVIPGLTLNTPMAIDPQRHHLFVAGRKPGKVFVIDTRTGKALQSLDCVETADDMSFDPAHRRLYVTGSGGVSIFVGTPSDRYTLESQFGTMKGKTSLYVPSLKRLYTIHAKSDGDGAGLQVYKLVR